MKLRNQSCQLILGHYILSRRYFVTLLVETKVPTCADKNSYLQEKKSALWGRNFQPIGTILYNIGSEKILLRCFLIKIENEPHNSRSFPFILKGEANDFERNLSGLQQNALSIILVLEWYLLKAVQCRRVIKTCYSKQRPYF